MARFYIDEDVARAVAVALFDRGHYMVSTDEMGLKGQSDSKQLRWATSERRILVTCNRRDFELLHEALVVWMVPERAPDTLIHAGILAIPNVGGRVAHNQADAIDEFIVAVSDARNHLFRLHSNGTWTQWDDGDRQ